MPGKFKIITSDLHLGAGREAEGNRLEDFGSDQDWAAFLDEIAAESERDGADLELIVNGDAFEMLQVPHVDQFDPSEQYAPELYHSSSEEDSVLKMALIIRGHREFFAALGRFLRTGPPRRQVTFIKGNHDLNLHWRSVQDQICAAVGAAGGRRSLISFEERRISREGIYVEHGNQYADVLSQVEDMEEPHDPGRPGQLALPVGSWFVMDAFNEMERERYWIDGVKPILALVWFALAFDFRFASWAIATLIRALPGILRMGVREFETPRGEVLAQQLENPAKVEQLASRYEIDEAFRTEFNSYVADVLSPPRPEDAAAARALPGVSDPVVMGEQIRKRVSSSLFRAAARRAEEEGVKLVSFGHTHDAGVEDLPNGGVYMNSGTWTWRADFGQEGKETWRDLFEHPELFTDDRLLSYVRVDYDSAGKPSGRLMAYEPKEDLLPTPAPETSRSWWQRFIDWFRTLLEL
jgi:UDP-2,3-diacylglucosamine pyrophosphatase LpxH